MASTALAVAPSRAVRRFAKAGAFRAPLLNDEDPLFLTLLSAVTAVTALLVSWVYTQPHPETVQAASVDDPLPIRPIPTYRIHPILLPIDAPPVVVDGAGAGTPDPPGASARPVRPPSGPILIGRPDEHGAYAAMLVGDEGLSEALSHVNSRPTASLGPIGTRAAQAGAPTDARLAMAPVVQHDAESGQGLSVKIKPVVRPVEQPAQSAETDGAMLRSVIKSRTGMYESCVELGLKQDPTLSGRVSVTWSIVNGVVRSISLEENTTGNTGVGSCFAKSVSGLRFGAGVNAEDVNYTWAVSGG